MMTPRERELLLIIAVSIMERGYSPTMDEMREGLGLRSKNGPHRLMRGLETRGFITRFPGRARGLDLTRRGCRALDGQTREMVEMLDRINAEADNDITLRLPDDLTHALRTHARFQHVKPETIAAEAIREYLGLGK